MYRNFVAKSPQMLDIISVVTKIAPTNSPVLIHGENGVGKSLVAEQIHLKSFRRNDLFVRINCFSKSNQLLESEIFGDVFNQKNDDSLDFSSNGTIFFDEIGYLPVSLQKKILDYIQKGEYSARIVASTSIDLESKVKDGTFLRELYYRLNGLPINIPALRYRKDDIGPLALYFCELFSKKTKKNFTGFTQNALEMLYDYYWQGNVRELKNTIEKSCILGHSPIIQCVDLNLGVKNEVVFDNQFIESTSDNTLKTALHNFKKNFVIQILDSVSWNQTEAAKIMGIQRTYLSKLMSDLDIRK